VVEEADNRPVRVEELEVDHDYAFRKARGLAAFGSPLYRVTYLGQDRRSGKARVRFPAGEVRPWSRDGEAAAESEEGMVILGQLLCAWGEVEELQAEEQAITALVEGEAATLGVETGIRAEATVLVLDLSGIPAPKEVYPGVIALTAGDLARLRELAGEFVDQGWPSDDELVHGRGERVYASWSSAEKIAAVVAAAQANELRPLVREDAREWRRVMPQRYEERIAPAVALIEEWCAAAPSMKRDEDELRAALAALARAVRAEEASDIEAAIAWADELLNGAGRRFEVQILPPPPGRESSRLTAATPSELGAAALDLLDRFGRERRDQLVFQVLVVEDDTGAEYQRELNPWELAELREVLG
jgi:hypothetical protein